MTKPTENETGEIGAITRDEQSKPKNRVMSIKREKNKLYILVNPQLYGFHIKTFSREANAFYLERGLVTIISISAMRCINHCLVVGIDKISSTFQANFIFFPVCGCFLWIHFAKPHSWKTLLTMVCYSTKGLSRAVQKYAENAVKLTWI